jgi:tRNA threonylcarbamoyladenosine biosynthesis protein TsaE
MPILDEHVLEFTSRSPEQTRRLGVRLGETLRGGECICLEGELGAGKTCLAQGIAAGWGVTGPVRSPTFTLIHEFRRPGDRHKLYPADLYRIGNASEAWALGLDDVWVRLEPDGGVCLIEWPEHAETILPAERLWVRLAVLDETRRMIRFTAQGENYQALLADFRRAAFGG